VTSIGLALTTTIADVICAVRVAPSILAADYARLGEQVTETLDAGARVIHVDVMDGHFVPPITTGPVVVSALSDRIHDYGGVVDVHLMIERPERQIAEFAKAGADVITIHHEATPNVHHALGAVRDAGCLAGLALNPATPAQAVVCVADILDLALCMTVNPGWGGQRFIESTRVKIARLRDLLPRDCAVEVDGGIDCDTAPACVERGANLLVAGSAIFGSPEPGRAYRAITAAVGSG
jgi:ribulose-phosphate 3-epimerase